MRKGAGIDGGEQSLGGQVGDAAAGAVAVALRRQIESADARDLRRLEFRLRFDQQPADDIGIDTGAAVILADLADDQQIELLERQPAHQAARFVQQTRLDLKQLVAIDHLQSRGLFAGVFQDGQPADEGRFLDNDAAPSPAACRADRVRPSGDAARHRRACPGR